MLHSRRPDGCSWLWSRRKKSAARAPAMGVSGTVKNVPGGALVTCVASGSCSAAWAALTAISFCEIHPTRTWS